RPWSTSSAPPGPKRSARQRPPTKSSAGLQACHDVAVFSRSLSLGGASGQAECADAARVGSRILPDVVADIPDRTVVGWVDGRLCVVLPALRARPTGAGPSVGCRALD